MNIVLQPPEFPYSWLRSKTIKTAAARQLLFQITPLYIVLFILDRLGIKVLAAVHIMGTGVLQIY